MLQKDDGIVLRTTRSGETSQVAVFLGRSSGKVRLMAKGALGPKSPWRGLFEPGHHIEVVYYFKEARSVYYIKEAASASPTSRAARRRDSLPHLAAMLAAMELLDLVCYHGSPDERVADLAVDYARHQDADDPLLMFLAFEVKLLEALGAAPEVSACAVCGSDLDGGAYSPREGASFCREHAGAADAVGLDARTVEEIARCMAEPFSALEHAEIDPARRKDLGKLVHWTYTHHVHGYSLPKSLNLI